MATILFLINIAAMALLGVIWVYIFAVKAKRAAMSLSNDLACDKCVCKNGENCTPQPMDNIPLPKWSTEFDKGMARYCADLVARVSVAVEGEFKPAPGHRVLADIAEPGGGRLCVVSATDAVVWICFRGTKSAKDLQTDADVQQISAYGLQLHEGFANAYGEVKDAVKDAVEDAVEDAVAKGGAKRVIVAGHSMGAALATICAWDLAALSPVVYNFASPRLMDIDSATAFNGKVVQFRIVNRSDIVPTMPPPVFGWNNSSGTPYSWKHCGVEMAFDDNWKSVINNHLIPVYMHNLQ